MRPRQTVRVLLIRVVTQSRVRGAITEAKQEESEVWLGTLERSPEIAKAIGAYLGDFTAFEFGLIGAFCYMSGIGFGKAQAYLGIVNLTEQGSPLDETSAQRTAQAFCWAHVSCRQTRNILARARRQPAAVSGAQC